MPNVFEGLYPRFKFQFLFQLPYLKQQPFICLLIYNLDWAQLGSSFADLIRGHFTQIHPSAALLGLSDPRRPEPHCTWGFRSGYLSSLPHGLFWRIVHVFSIVVELFQESNHQCRIANQASDSVVFADAYWLKKITKSSPCK